MTPGAGLILAAAVAAAAPAHEKGEPPTAVTREYTGAFQPCLDSDTGATTLGQMRCIEAERKVQDERLNAAYKKAMDDLNARQKARLVAAERAWVAFRDASCSALYDEDWGTISKVMSADCYLTRTIERALELKDYPYRLADSP